MNGIRLAAVMAAVILFSQADSPEVAAQSNRGQAYSNAYGGRTMGPGTAAQPAARNNRGQQDQPMSGPPSGVNPNGNGSRSRSSNSRRRSSTRSSRSSNAIETNPLFQFLDTDGDGELSLEEIDAASRLLYSLDADEDDRITADEVEDMAVAGDGGSQDRVASSRSSNRSSTNRSSSNRSSTNRSSRSRTSGRATNSQGMQKSGMALGMPSAGGGMAPSAGGNASAADDDFFANDKNEDGVLKRSEMPRAYRTKFTKMDTNKDGEIDEDEFYDFIDNQ
jgi:Ca2+-binding EF-hand superfamily protein